MSKAALFLARFCSSAWIGAAALFVIVGIREVTFPDFDTITRDQLVMIRFPAYYWAGTILIALAWAGSCAAEYHVELPNRRRAFAILALLAAMALMFIDYHWVYTPLVGMITPPGKARLASFVSYHQASKYINMAGLVFTLIASICLNWPGPRQDTK